MEGCVLRPPNSQLFSDNVIGGVVERSTAASRYRSSHVCEEYHPHEGHGAFRTRHQEGETGTPSTNLPHNNRAAEPTTRQDQLVAMAELATAEKLRLRELRRERQIRYRKKKENYMHSLEDETRQLRDEIEQLEQRRRSVSAAVPAIESAWRVAAEYFRLFRYGVSEASVSVSSSSSEAQPSAQLNFLRASMTADVAFNGERGAEVMLRTWSCVSRWFAGVEMDLERLEKDATGSLVATTTFTVTITEQTLSIVFPHLSTGVGQVGSAASFLSERLEGQTITMRGSTRFEWDGAYCCVTSVMSQSDMLTPMLRLVGSLEDVSRVFEGARITPDFRLKSAM
ncbi:hypothetical protein PHYSODRAFT_506493 [Phytophthora sojae]|uniref:BZIP domain-containing protein n=1 Tax=Phytophthora sojae (strain P6497) TaxID=1094619 RepID=G4ZPM3_PHYSP|nr:hypothetical protein PHYSODRAFT_506493 [Phytophthora sojae]EGZ16335.1 hypothetical protein PHYSODRAFT_506493 [Phytophthora sojae]|eukprot:XP_009530084.1 hypothetical protein PHYSODRAFT_506493 [Phytophthora sojae]